MPLAVTNVEFSIFLHITAVVVGFGATFSESVMFPVAMKMSARNLPYVHRLQLTLNQFFAIPAAIVVAATGIYQVDKFNFDYGNFWLSATITILVVIFLVNILFFIPTDRRLLPIIEKAHRRRRRPGAEALRPAAHLPAFGQSGGDRRFDHGDSADRGDLLHDHQARAWLARIQRCRPRFSSSTARGHRDRGEGSAPFAARLREELGSAYEIQFPIMPGTGGPALRALERAAGRDPGRDRPARRRGRTLARRLGRAQAPAPRPIGASRSPASSLVATPFWGDEDWAVEWALPEGWPGASAALPPDLPVPQPRRRGDPICPARALCEATPGGRGSPARRQWAPLRPGRPDRDRRDDPQAVGELAPPAAEAVRSGKRGGQLGHRRLPDAVEAALGEADRRPTSHRGLVDRLSPGLPVHGRLELARLCRQPFVGSQALDPRDDHVGGPLAVLELAARPARSPRSSPPGGSAPPPAGARSG